MYEEPEKVNSAELDNEDKDSLMAQIKDLRVEQKITPSQIIPEIQKQKQNFFTKNQKPLFFLFLVSVIINMACFIVLLFL